MAQADTMRRLLLGKQEQGDMFGEVEPEKPKPQRKQYIDRPIQQSLEGLDDGMLFSTFSPKEPPHPGQKGWGDSNMSLRAEQAVEEGRRTAGMIAKEYGLKAQTVRDMLRSKEWHHVLPKGRKTPVSEYFYDFHPETDEVDATRLQEMKATESGRKSDALQKRTRTLAAKNLGLKHNASTGSVEDSEGNHVGTFRPWGFDASYTKNERAAKQMAERMGLNRSLLDGNYYTEEKSHPDKSVVQQGIDAMERVISDQTDVPQAMSHPLIGDLSFYWGAPGTEGKNFHDGHGVSHIIAARNAQNQDGIEAARHMVRVIAEGQVGEPYQNGQRLNITLGEASAVFDLRRNGTEEKWLLTGWKEAAPDETGESYNRQSYARQSSVNRTDAGAGASTDPTIPQPGEDVKQQFSTKKQDPRSASELIKELKEMRTLALANTIEAKDPDGNKYLSEERYTEEEWMDRDYGEEGRIGLIEMEYDERIEEIEDQERDRIKQEKEDIENEKWHTETVELFEKIENKVLEIASELEFDILDQYGSGAHSRYIRAQYKDNNSINIRISDHYAKRGAGFNQGTQDYYDAPDINIVSNKFEKIDFDAVYDEFLDLQYSTKNDENLIIYIKESLEQTDKKAPLYIGKTSERITDILSKLGVNIEKDSENWIESHRIRHSKRSHPDMTVEDFLMIPKVIKTPTFLGYSENADGFKRIWFLKQNGGDTLYIGVYGKNKNRITMRGFYKDDKDVVLNDLKQKGVHLVAVANSAVSPKGKAGSNPAETSRTPDKTIPQPSEDVKPKFSTIEDKAARNGYHWAAFHGSPNKGFTVFSPQGSRFGVTWMAKDAELSETYINDKITKEPTGEVRGFFLDLGDDPVVVDAKGNKWNHIPHPDKPGVFTFTDGIAYRAKQAGKTGVIIHNVMDGDDVPRTIYGVFNPENIKSADEMTFDDQGNEIPLERRFDRSKQDVRYSTRSGDSNLNPGQQKQVRSDNFKRWFGDWEAAKQREFLEGEPVVRLTGEEFPNDGTSLFDRVNKFILNLSGGTVASKVVGDVIINRRGIRNSWNHNKNSEKAIAFAAVPKVIEEGTEVYREDNWKGRGYERILLAAPITIKNEPYVAVVAINKAKDSSRFYFHEVALTKKIRESALSAGSSADMQVPVETSGAQRESIKSILQNIFRVNPAKTSKVVDDSGIPKLMYHATRAAINEFRVSRYRHGIYFSETPDSAMGGMLSSEREFAGDQSTIETFGQNIMPVYLSAKRLYGKSAPPLLEDVETEIIPDNEVENHWKSFKSKAKERLDNIDFNKFKTDSPSRTTVKEFAEKILNKEIQLWFNYFDNGNGTHTFRRTDEPSEYRGGRWQPITERHAMGWETFERGPSYYDHGGIGALALKSLGYDSAQISDEGKGTIVVFSPTQIKSATGNSGAFDPDNPDIRYSTTDTTPRPVPLPELARLTVDMLGSQPQIRRKMQALGLFKREGDVGGIKLKADIFIGPDLKHSFSRTKPTKKQIDEHVKQMAEEHGVPEEDIVIKTSRQKNGWLTSTYKRDHNYAGWILAHEIGHAEDWLPDKNMGRGNILGRIAKLNNFMDDLIGKDPETVFDTDWRIRTIRRKPEVRSTWNVFQEGFFWKRVRVPRRSPAYAQKSLICSTWNLSGTLNLSSGAWQRNMLVSGMRLKMAGTSFSGRSTARAVIMDAATLSMVSGNAPCTTSMWLSPRRAITRCRKPTLPSLRSMSVQGRSGNRHFSGMMGKPPPEPMSRMPNLGLAYFLTYGARLQASVM